MTDFIAVDLSSPVPIYWQIADGIRQCIARGEMLPGDVLPSLRALASHLRVSVSSVAKAYALLASEGLVSTRRGKGSVVSTRRPASRQADTAYLDQCLLEAISAAEALGISREELTARLASLLDRSQRRTLGETDGAV